MDAFTGWHLVLVLFMVAGAVLWFAAFWSIARSERTTGTERAVWILIVIVAPLLGALLWFAIGKRGGFSGGDGASLRR